MNTNTTDSLSPLCREVYAILQTAEDWLTLREIAAYLQRRKGLPLPGDRAAVRELAGLGLIEVEERTRGAAQIYYAYRVRG